MAYLSAVIRSQLLGQTAKECIPVTELHEVNEGRWVGLTFVVSMKARTGRTPANFTDVMVVSLASNDGMTIVIMRTAISGHMTTYTLKYRKS